MLESQAISYFECSTETKKSRLTYSSIRQPGKRRNESCNLLFFDKMECETANLFF